MTESSLTLCLLSSLALMNDRKSLLSLASRPVQTQNLLLAVHLYAVLTSRKPRSMSHHHPSSPSQSCRGRVQSKQTGGLYPSQHWAHCCLSQVTTRHQESKEPERVGGLVGCQSSQSPRGRHLSCQTLAFDAQAAGSSPPPYQAALVNY